ncbi:5-formyltetrahydrofolate cyclo-ligase [Aphelenchoides fujianensis]|nr:5-formyltetrahydrofolate cyclo-ligase [Aphelenchoides fujianensis]
MADDLKQQKKKLRKEMAALLGALDAADVKRQSAEVEKKIWESDWYKRAKVVSIYVSTVGEIETDRLIKRAYEDGKTVFIPRFEKGNLRMQMVRLQNMQEFEILQPSLWGIRQFEQLDGRQLFQDFGPIDLVLAPGVAFTRAGDRCGHGMAFYDKFFCEHKELFGKSPFKAALALREQVLDEVPTNETDVRLDAVIFADN